MLKDYEVIGFKTAQDTKQYLEERRITDRWVICPVSKCAVYADEGDGSLFSKIDREKVSEESISECAGDIGLFIKFYDKEVKHCVIYPMRYTAMDSLLDRAGLRGRTMVNTEEKPGIKVLPLKEKAAFLTRCLKLYDGNCKILIRDEKVSAVLSDQYAVLPVYELEESLQEILAKEYPMAELKDGTATHEFITMRWDLKDDAMEEDLRCRLEDCGKKVSKVNSVLKFLTSDVGESHACVFPYFEVDGISLRCGRPLKVEHKGKKTVFDFAKLLPKINAMFKNDESRIENLASTVIKHPADCFRAIACHQKMPKMICKKLSENLECMATCSALEVYYWLHVAVMEFEGQEKNPGITAILDKQEKAAAALYLDFKEFDHPFAWVKGE